MIELLEFLNPVTRPSRKLTLDVTSLGTSSQSTKVVRLMPNPAEGVDFLPLHSFSWQGQVREFTITPHPDVAAASLQPDYEYLVIFIDLQGPTNGKTCSRSVSFSTEGDLLLKVDLEEDDRRKFEGVGLLSGSFPLNMVTQEGNLPSHAEIRILYRPNTGDLGDGVLVAAQALGDGGAGDGHVAAGGVVGVLGHYRGDREQRGRGDRHAFGGAQCGQGARLRPLTQRAKP